MQAVHAPSFGRTEPQMNQWPNRSRTIAARSTGPTGLGKLPARSDQTLSVVLSCHPRVLLDDTEQSVLLTTDDNKQRAHYLGKKRHTVKNNLSCCLGKRVLFLSVTYSSSVYDKAF